MKVSDCSALFDRTEKGVGVMKKKESVVVMLVELGLLCTRTMEGIMKNVIFIF